MRLVRENVRPQIGSSITCLSLETPQFDNQYHHHPETELTWIEESEGQRLIGDAVEPFQAGDLALIGGGMPHHYRNWAAGRARAKVIQFCPERFGEALLALPEFRAVSLLLAESARGLTFSAPVRREARAAIRRLFEEKEAAMRLVRLLEVLHLLSGDPARRAVASPVYGKPIHARKLERLQRALNYIESRWTEPIRLEEAARVAALHPQSMSRFFRQHLGLSFQEYLVRLRLTRAARLLIETDRTVADIAFSCGFNNLANFNRHFLAAYTCTPTAYRARL